MAGTVKPTFGIAQANDLISKLATGDNADLVVHVIRTTLESAGVQVGELIAEAERREGELRTQIQQRRSTIADLERRMGAERTAIAGLESELAMTSRTRFGLESSKGKGVRMTPVPIPERGSRDSDRPTTVMPVAKGQGETVLGDADFESIPPAEPKSPPKGPRPSGAK